MTIDRDMWQAVTLRLKGYKYAYIEDVTGFSQKDIKSFASGEGVSLSKSAIFDYQVEYLKSNYSIQEIESAYMQMMFDYEDPSKECNFGGVELLGCMFGQYSKVLKVILGDKRQYELSREARTRKLLDRYGVEHPNQNAEIAARMTASVRATNQERYGVDYATQRPDVAKKVHDARQATMLEKYGAANSVQVPELREKIFASRVFNGTLNSSSGEELIYMLLCEQFGADDVQRNVVIDNRYPYHVDFYIRSRDLFIEYNGDRCHMDCWFDESNPEHLELVEEWRNRARVVEAESGKTSRYTKYISTWTGSDVDKRTKAKDSGLNYLVFWDEKRQMRDGVSYPRLQDFHEWLVDGCPDPQDWVREADSCHTY